MWFYDFNRTISSISFNLTINENDFSLNTKQKLQQLVQCEFQKDVGKFQVGCLFKKYITINSTIVDVIIITTF